jgi:hypothetical protein
MLKKLCGGVEVEFHSRLRLNNEQYSPPSSLRTQRKTQIKLCGLCVLCGENVTVIRTETGAVFWAVNGR